MSKLLIESGVTVPQLEVADKNRSLEIAEFFSNTIQGEGRYTGYPAAFLRLKNCTLSCTWCDTMSVWRKGHRFSFDELFKLMEESGTIDFLKNGAHLVITGGSPLLQQEQIVLFHDEFCKKYGFKPFVEIENECVLMPSPDMLSIVEQWNCSPKLSNSLQEKEEIYHPEVIKALNKGAYYRTDYKFVVSSDEDWDEIDEWYIKTGLISKEDIILMPEGETQAELKRTRERMADLAIKEGMRFCDRLHITIWDKRTGV